MARERVTGIAIPGLGSEKDVEVAGRVFRGWV